MLNDFLAAEFSLYIFPVPAWVFSGCFLPQTKDMDGGLINDSNLAVGVSVHAICLW